MGHNICKKLVLTLKEAAGIEVFIETGTYKAQTALWAAAHFEKVYTIEAYEPRFVKTIAGLQKPIPSNIDFIYGDSRVKLAEVLEQILSPAIIWLDAHWCGEGAHDSNGNECPLLEELEAINGDIDSDHHIIIIDDAKLFQAPPPYPHDPTQWPHLSTFINKIGTGRRVIKIDHDMIVSVPERYKNLLDEEWY